MRSISVRAVLILAMLLAFTGGAVAQAAQSQPDSAFYRPKTSPKLVIPDVELGVQGIAVRQLVMAQKQVREIIRLANQGEDPGEEIQLKLEAHLRLALQNAAQLGDGEMLGFLNRIQSMLQTQLQLLNQARQHAGAQAEEPLGLAIQTMAHIQAQVQAGLQDPAEFRLRAKNGQLDELVASKTAAELALPIGDEHQYGPQASQPGPGQPGGNPDCPLDDCNPVGDSNQYGPQPDQPGPGQPGGNPDCVDCVPVGDQNMNGEPPADPGNGGSGGQGGSGGK